MPKPKRVLLFTVVSLCIAAAGFGQEDLRTWVDSTGKHSFEAKLVSSDDSNVVLLGKDGKEITVPIDKLSSADQMFLKAVKANEPAPEPMDDKPVDHDAALREVSSKFYSDLRTDERSVAGTLLTATGQTANQGGNSPLADLPKPDAGSRSIRVGKATVEGETAEVPVVVRAGGQSHATQLHLKLEDGNWRVFALSAKLGEDEKTINFEVAPPPAAEPGKAVALTDFIGKQIEFTGTTLNGESFDISAMRGKVVLIDFWATWCGPCIAEMPNIRANYEKYHSAGFEVIGCSLDSDLDALAGFVAEEKPPWLILADAHEKNAKSMANAFSITGIPAFILVGPDGKVVTVNCRGQRLGAELAKIFGS